MRNIINWIETLQGEELTPNEFYDFKESLREKGFNIIENHFKLFATKGKNQIKLSLLHYEGFISIFL